MAFTESHRAAIRAWGGWAAAHRDLQLERQITACQSIADGGINPDSSAELLIIGYLTELAALDLQIQEVLTAPEAFKVNELTIDPARGLAILCKRGRQLIGRLFNAMNYSPRCDVFGSPVLYRER